MGFDFWNAMSEFLPMPTVRIRIHDLEAWCRVGVPDTERARPQRLLFDIEFDAAAGQADDISATVDYFAVAQIALGTAESRPRKLIETLARDILDALAAQFPIADASVRVRKFSVPSTGEVSVEMRHPGQLENTA